MATKSIRLTDGTDTLLSESAENGYGGGSTNYNGYQKFADGTLICYGWISITASGNSTANTSITFLHEFLHNPKVFTSAITTTPQYHHSGVAGITTTGCNLYFYNSSGSSRTNEINYIAIGVWK